MSFFTFCAEGCSSCHSSRTGRSSGVAWVVSTRGKASNLRPLTRGFAPHNPNPQMLRPVQPAPPAPPTLRHWAEALKEGKKTVCSELAGDRGVVEGTHWGTPKGKRLKATEVVVDDDEWSEGEEGADLEKEVSVTRRRRRGSCQSPGRAALAEKKSKKPGLIAKSSILLDVKPWDDETDMAKMEECVRSVQMDGLVWGASQLVPVGYGINKLQIQYILEEEITKFEDYIQSVDIAAFNKI
uniref:Elongation factor 1-delta n=1 Tax=Podarcis muralis TaxID=64176 RepID=A0A670JSC9_PODMU